MNGLLQRSHAQEMFGMCLLNLNLFYPKLYIIRNVVRQITFHRVEY